MTRPRLPADVTDETERRRDRERLARLARSDRAGYTAQTGGAQQLLAPDGTVLFSFGDFSDPDDTSRYGVALYDASGNVVLSVDEDVDGLVWPGDTTAWGTTAPAAVTSGSFADYHSAYLLGANGDVIYASGALTTDSGTTAEARIRAVRYTESGLVDGYTNTVTVPSGGAGGWTLAWAHDLAVGQPPTGSALALNRFALEVRRASGAGNVYLYRPRILACTSSRFTAAAAIGSALTYA